MVIDKLEHIGKYVSLHPLFAIFNSRLNRKFGRIIGIAKIGLL